MFGQDCDPFPPPKKSQHLWHRNLPAPSKLGSPLTYISCILYLSHFYYSPQHHKEQWELLRQNKTKSYFSSPSIWNWFYLYFQSDVFVTPYERAQYLDQNMSTSSTSVEYNSFMPCHFSPHLHVICLPSNTFSSTLPVTTNINTELQAC